jgi:hypothetical protein
LRINSVLEEKRREEKRREGREEEKRKEDIINIFIDIIYLVTYMIR